MKVSSFFKLQNYKNVVLRKLGCNITYSQEGEDIILERIFAEKQKGFYVDVGAHHPKRFSNTYKLYLKGWSGINIDAWPGSMEAFKKIRKRDINLEIPISSDGRTMDFFIFAEPAYNTFSADRLEEYKTYSALIETRSLTSQTLFSVLSTHMPKETEIDVLNIDIEGLDLEALQSNDWNLFRPAIILVEDREWSITNPETQVYRFLIEKGYRVRSKMDYTLIFSLA